MLLFCVITIIFDENTILIWSLNWYVYFVGNGFESLSLKFDYYLWAINSYRINVTFESIYNQIELFWKAKKNDNKTNVL
jgi:hypothetical protein